MKKYIGFKLIQAEPMSLGDYNTFRGWKIPSDEDPMKEGYKILYPDGYVSWSPNEVFETSYMQIGDNNSITQQNVDSFIKEVSVNTLGEKTTVVRATLVNGFEIVESSSCVDPANYCEKMGAEICLNRIKNKIWELLGFLLQTANKGIN
ncbi:Gp49 family protein [Peribacillus acanthi]|uniref:Gp49 family protein n=1 Tax=Peribacillus acanthi TaxID=2171554 RepID=UPI000D3E4265|nr:Gp49 family protein [Peribacillus acanthi]